MNCFHQHGVLSPGISGKYCSASLSNLKSSISWAMPVLKICARASNPLSALVKLQLESTLERPQVRTPASCRAHAGPAQKTSGENQAAVPVLSWLSCPLWTGITGKLPQSCMSINCIAACCQFSTPQAHCGARTGCPLGSRGLQETEHSPTGTRGPSLHREAGYSKFIRILGVIHSKHMLPRLG